jgi:hypothetical protein
MAKKYGESAIMNQVKGDSERQPYEMPMTFGTLHTEVTLGLLQPAAATDPIFVHA